MRKEFLTYESLTLLLDDGFNALPNSATSLLA